MPNKFYSKDAVPSKQSWGEGGSNKASGRAPSLSMPERTAAWPGLPGKSGPNRSGGAPTSGKLGQFRVKREGI